MSTDADVKAAAARLDGPVSARRLAELAAVEQVRRLAADGDLPGVDIPEVTPESTRSETRIVTR